MKKFIYLMAMVCTLGFFTACSSDDDNDEKEFVRNEKIEGTWNLQEVTKQDLGNGSECTMAQPSLPGIVQRVQFSTLIWA